MYYPELKNVKLTIFNKLEIKKNVENNPKLMVEDFRHKYNFLLERSKEKCRLNNILYEISRI